VPAVSSAGEWMKGVLQQQRATAILVLDALRYDLGAALADEINRMEGATRASVTPGRSNQTSGTAAPVLATDRSIFTADPPLAPRSTPRSPVVEETSGSRCACSAERTLAAWSWACAGGAATRALNAPACRPVPSWMSWRVGTVARGHRARPDTRHYRRPTGAMVALRMEAEKGIGRLCDDVTRRVLASRASPLVVLVRVTQAGIARALPSRTD
jgi:hypothetical protein